MAHPLLRSTLGLVAFGCVICATPIAIAAIPPEHGSLLIVSLRGESSGRIVAWAANGGLALRARGPIEGSVVVDGLADRAHALARVHGAIVLRAPQAGCGSAT